MSADPRHCHLVLVVDLTGLVRDCPAPYLRRELVINDILHVWDDAVALWRGSDGVHRQVTADGVVVQPG